MTPETHFAENDGVSIAYQVFGDGSQDLIFIPGWLSNLDILWEEPRVARFLLSLARIFRVTVIDRRGTGLSDRVAPPTLEVQMGDVTAVMDAAGSERAAFLGNSEGGSMCALFAATHPDRTTALITVGGYAKWIKSDDYPYGTKPSEAEQWFEQVENEWGGPIAIDFISPSLANDEKHRHWLAKFYRSSASKANAIAMLRMGADIDLRAILPTINVPSLVLQAKADLTNSLDSGRDLASRIPNAKLVEMECRDHVLWGDCSEVIIGEIQNFLGEKQTISVTDRALATVLFTDIVDSTQLANDLGDEKWSDLLEGHNEAVRRQLEIFRGNEVKTTGDGFHATFDGPARAIQCAASIREATRQLGLSLRIGIHTGECEIRGESLEGVAIHLAARVSGMASAGEIVVSRTVKDLVAGSGIEFEDFGVHALKGISGEQQLFKVVA
ncbi:MAG: adenylate/guanylate cyclase domain-containing protein [Gammaproteobacteria bacterium]|nr:adenylate/guanylate cyclase domain-containing protein [Gammaproteobacteria bacterium]MDH3464665.1 adenylate/guanylate cyclase domain-containing protein [Gammaproteobacteria bacterium]